MIYKRAGRALVNVLALACVVVLALSLSALPYASQADHSFDVYLDANVLPHIQNGTTILVAYPALLDLVYYKNVQMIQLFNPWVLDQFTHSVPDASSLGPFLGMENISYVLLNKQFVVGTPPLYPLMSLLNGTAGVNSTVLFEDGSNVLLQVHNG